MQRWRWEEGKGGRKRRCLLYFLFASGVTASSTGLLATWVLCARPAEAQPQSRPQLCAAWTDSQCSWAEGNLHGLRLLQGVSPAEPFLDKWQMLPAWNGVLLLTVLNFLQNWPVRGLGSSFLAHLSGSDSFCSGIIKRVVSFSFPFQLHVPKPVISRGNAFVWLLGRAASAVRGSSSAGPSQRHRRLGSSFLKDRALALSMIQAGGTTLAFPAAHLSSWVALEPPSLEPASLASAAAVQVCWVAAGTSSLNSTPLFCSGVWVACSFPDQQGLLQTVRCKPGEKMAFKTLDLILEGSVRSWIDAPSAVSLSNLLATGWGTLVAGRQVGGSFSLEIFSYS